MAKDSAQNGGQRDAKYPFYVLAPCLRVGESVAKHGGGSAPVPKDLVASDVEADPSSSAFSSLMASAKTWQIIQGQSELNLTELARDYFFPLTEQAKQYARLGFLVGPSAFKALVEQMDGKRLPTNEILGHQLGRIGVPASWRIRAAGIFVSAAKELGVIDANGFLRYSVEMHKAKSTAERIPLAAESGSTDQDAAAAQSDRPAMGFRGDGAASLKQHSSNNIWEYREGGGWIRLEMSDPLPMALWKRLERVVKVLKPELDDEGGDT